MTPNLRQKIAQSLITDATNTGRISALDRVVLVTYSASGLIQVRPWKSLTDFEAITNGESPDLIEQARATLQAGAVRIVLMVVENSDGTFEESAIGEYAPNEKPTNN